MPKAFDYVDHNKLWKILKEMGIPDHLTCLLRNLYAGQDTTARTGHGTTDWFQIGKRIHQSCILSPCLFNLHAEYIMRNAGLDEAQAGIKIAGRNINNPDTHDGVITQLEPDILNCEVKWALGSITMNKASRGDGIPAELFQILKDDAVKVLHSICQKFGKLSSGHKTGKGQFSFQSQRKAMPKNAQTTTQLHSSHTLVK